MLTDFYLKMENKLIPEQRKIFLYSVHDGTIVNVLHALNSFFPPNPPYGAHILVELHEIDNVYGIKVYQFIYLHFQPIIIYLFLITDLLPRLDNRKSTIIQNIWM